MAVAIKQLPGDVRTRLEKLFDEGLLKEGDLDLRSITVFASLNEGLQQRVMAHLEGERIYVANARSKSGFLIATCDKAKTGCLDARGLGAIDPWRTALVAMATPKMKVHELKPERDWIDQAESSVIKIQVSLGSSVEAELGVPNVTVEVPLTETASAIKAKLAAMGVKSIPVNKMKLNIDPLGFLKDRYSFAYYNLKDGIVCTLSERKRGGIKYRADHSVMPKKPCREQTKSAEEKVGGASRTNGVQAITLPGDSGAKAPGLPTMPKLGGLPGLPGLQGLPGLPGLPGFGGMTAAGPGQMPGFAGLLGGARPAGAAPVAFRGMPGMPTGMPALPGQPKAGPAPGSLESMMPGLDLSKLDLTKGGALPGLPPLNADPKAAAMAFVAKQMGAPPSAGETQLTAKTPGPPPMPAAATSPDGAGAQAEGMGMPGGCGMPGGVIPNGMAPQMGATAKGGMPLAPPMAS